MNEKHATETLETLFAMGKRLRIIVAAYAHPTHGTAYALLYPDGSCGSEYTAAYAAAMLRQEARVQAAQRAQ